MNKSNAVSIDIKVSKSVLFFIELQKMQLFNNYK